MDFVSGYSGESRISLRQTPEEGHQPNIWQSYDENCVKKKEIGPRGWGGEWGGGGSAIGVHTVEEFYQLLYRFLLKQKVNNRFLSMVLLPREISFSHISEK